MKGKHFLKLLDLTSEEISQLLASAAAFKAQKKARILITAWNSRCSSAAAMPSGVMIVTPKTM